MQCVEQGGAVAPVIGLTGRGVMQTILLVLLRLVQCLFDGVGPFLLYIGGTVIRISYKDLFQTP